jgi:hypothetical protein
MLNDELFYHYNGFKPFLNLGIVIKNLFGIVWGMALMIVPSIPLYWLTEISPKKNISVYVHITSFFLVFLYFFEFENIGSNFDTFLFIANTALLSYASIFKILK